MGSPYERKDQKNPKKRRWWGRVKIGSNWEDVSLRLLAPDNKRLAEQRLRDLEFEIRAGALSDATKEWLGPAAMRLEILIGRAGMKAEPGSPTCWESSVDAWLKACEPKDTRGEIRGKVVSIDRTKKQRRHVMKRFEKWLISRREPFLKRPFTEIAREYLQHEVGRGQKSSTIHGGAYPYLLLFGEWLADRGVCERPNRKRIHEVVPKLIPAPINLPDWRIDRDTIRFFRDNRHTTAHNWKRNRRYYCAWCFIVLVRGLGCRPSEALSLSWDTVFLEPGFEKVRFLDTKDGRKTGRPHRTAPVLFEWVREALVEMKERHGRSGGPVCPNPYGQPYRDDSSHNQMIREILIREGRPRYTLKKMQKYYITQLIQAGFPPHVVAFWTGHTLTVQERHYIEENAYLPQEERDYGELGVLSEFGRKALAQFARHVGPVTGHG